jgi:hypothetical protein
MPPTVPPAPTKKKQKKSHKKIKELRTDRIRTDRISMQRKRQKLTNESPSTVSSPSPRVPCLLTVTPPPPTTTTITPTHSAQHSKTAPNQFTARVQSIQKSQGVVLDDTKILVSLRKRFVESIKLLKKTPLDSKGLKKIVNSNFALSYNPTVPFAATRRTRSPVPVPIPVQVTQSQPSSQASTEDSAALIELPPTVPSHGTVESTTFRRYLLEDIMGAPVNENWIILVSSEHPFYESYSNLSRQAPSLPLKYVRGSHSYS